MISDEFEWDEAKARTNLRKHKVSFRQACRVFEDLFVLIEQGLTEDHVEDRFVAAGTVSDIVLTVVYAERETRIRIISARKANSAEQRKYHLGQTPP
jgi:hypothetical protein